MQRVEASAVLKVIDARQKFFIPAFTVMKDQKINRICNKKYNNCKEFAQNLLYYISNELKYKERSADLCLP